MILYINDSIYRLIDWIVFYAVSAIFQPYNGGLSIEENNVGHSSNFSYQGFAEKYLLGIYLHSNA